MLCVCQEDEEHCSSDAQATAVLGRDGRYRILDSKYCADTVLQEHTAEGLAQWAAANGIVRVARIAEKDVPALRAAVPLVNTDRMRVGPLVFVCTQPDDHPALREMLIWLSSRPKVRAHEKCARTATPPECYVLASVLVERDAGCDLPSVLSLGGRLIVVGDRVIEPAFTEAYEDVELVVPLRRKSSDSGLVQGAAESAAASQPSQRPAARRRSSPRQMYVSGRTAKEDGLYSQVCLSPAEPAISRPHSQPAATASARDIAEANRKAIIKFTRLELRSKGIEPGHDDFDALVDRLSLGVRFTFRRDFSSARVPNDAIIAEIRSNLNHVGF